jgi:sirohydrochlorin ferrochelatase
MHLFMSTSRKFSQNLGVTPAPNESLSGATTDFEIGTKTATVLVGHGSILAASGTAMFRIADHLRTQGVTPIVEAGFLNFSQPTFADAVAQAQTQGADHIIVQPYFLIEGHYVARELPTLVQTVAASHPGLRFILGGVLGSHPALVQLACERLSAINPEPNADTALLFVAHGTPLADANAPIEQVLNRVAQQAGYGRALIGYLDCNEPSIPAAFAHIAATGVSRIDVLPYFLHLGRHVRTDLPAHFAAARATHPQVDIHIAQHLDYDPLLAQAVAERTLESLIC